VSPILCDGGANDDSRPLDGKSKSDDHVQFEQRLSPQGKGVEVAMFQGLEDFPRPLVFWSPRPGVCIRG
jgi:hypothetical protein